MFQTAYMKGELTEESYRKLKREVEDAKSEAERAAGALDQLMSQLKKEFKCTTLKEAKALLEELENKQEKAKEKFDDALKAYEEKWKQDEE